MKTKKTSLIKFGIYASAILMLLTALLQFAPFWHGPEETTSMVQYIWSPTTHKDTTAYLTEQLGDFSLNSIVSIPLLQLALAALGIILTLLKNELPVGAAIAGLSGLCGSYMFLSKPAYRLGSLWQLHLALNIVMAVIGIATLILYFVQRNQEKQQKYGSK